MKYFKIEANRTSRRYEITPDKFQKVTQRKYPFEQKDEKGKLSQYGICPSCLNSIQLIGISHEIKNNPHGKHTGKNIKDLPPWNQRKYEYCPFAAKNDRREPEADERLAEIDSGVVELYNLLKLQFDRVIFVLKEELGIKCSDNFWRNALNQYLVNRAFCYPWLTEANLPYIFAYFGIHHQRLFKQEFLIGSDIYNTLKNYNGVDFIFSEYQNINNNTDESKKYARLVNKDNTFLKLFFRFTEHTNKAVNGNLLNETMLFCVDDRDTGETVFEKRIEFNETYFMNLINLSEDKCYRNQKLLDIAKELMPELM